MISEIVVVSALKPINLKNYASHSCDYANDKYTNKMENSNQDQ